MAAVPAYSCRAMVRRSPALGHTLRTSRTLPCGQVACRLRARAWEPHGHVASRTFMTRAMAPASTCAEVQGQSPRGSVLIGPARFAQCSVGLCRRSLHTVTPPVSAADAAASTATAATSREQVRAKLAALREAKAAIQLTDRAAERIKELLSSQSDVAGIRVGVRKRGCSGNTYVMDYAKEKGKFDEEVADKGVRVFINPQALLKVTGTVLDFQEDDIGSQFVFDNPNAKGSCGCGESFYV